jgi:molybdopterin molybdotransferase
VITVREHLERVLAQVGPGPEVRLPLEEAFGLVLAQDVRSPVDLPRFDNSAMDGYAVRAEDVAAADPEEPLLLPVLGDIPAGAGEPRRLRPGTAWRIMTGAPVPEGADAVVPVEDTDGHPREVQIRRPAAPGRHIRRAGEDLRAGQVIVPRGTRIGPPQVAALASAGVSTVRVIGPVRVAVLSTGDELVPLGQPVGPGQIQDSNGPMLVAAVRAAGHYALHGGYLPDDEKVIRSELRRHLEHADVVITTGGVSKGAYDAVKAVLTGEGTMTFTEVAMQPGKPQGFGLLGSRRVPVFTLPGNPVSALVSFEVFIRPALARRAGLRFHPREVTAIATEGWRSPEGKEQYLRVRLSRDPSGAVACTPSGGAGSHLVGGLALADGLAVVPADRTSVRAGSTVRVRALRPLEEIEADLDHTDPDHTDQDHTGDESEAGA